MQKLVYVVIYVSAFLPSFSQVTSNFSVDIESWTAPNSLAGVAYNSTGGNPTGFISATPTFNPPGLAAAFPIYFYFTAPSKFLGNFSSYYNGALTYNLQQGTLSTAVIQAEVILSNGGTTLYYFPSTPFNPSATPAWSSHVVTLNELSGFWKTANSDTSPTASQAQIQSVLGNLTSVLIRGRYNSILAPPATGLDNVVLQPVISVTTQPSPQTVCSGTVVNLTTAASGNNNLSYQWQIFNAATNSYNDIVASAIFSGQTSATLAINTSGNVGAGAYRCRISGNNTASVVTNLVSLVVNANPAGPTITGNSVCGSGSLILNASGGVNGQYRWYTTPVGGACMY